MRQRAADAARLDELEPAIAEFLDASGHQQRRAARLRTLVVAGLVVLVVSASGVAVYQARAAATQARAAIVNSLVSEAGGVRDSEPATALRLALAALKTSPSAETRAALVRLLVGSRYVGELEPNGIEVRGLVVSKGRNGNGHTVIVGGGKTSPSLVWDVSDPAKQPSGYKPDGARSCRRPGATREARLVREPRQGRLTIVVA